MFTKATLRKRYGRKVWDCDFEIMFGPKGNADLEQFKGKALRRYLSLPQDKNFPALRSNFAKDFRKVIGLLPPRNICSFNPADIYGGCVVEAVVQTIARDDDGDELPEGARTSVIRRIRRCVAGVPPYLQRRARRLN